MARLDSANRWMLRAALAIGLAVAGCASSGDDRTDSAQVATDADSTSPSATSTAPAATTDSDSVAPGTDATTTTTTGLAGSADVAADAACVRVADFDDETERWVVVNDGVMGGRSQGAVAFSESAMQFTGTVVTAGGGFTSVRLAPDDGALADSDRLELRVRTDGRAYAITLSDASSVGRRTTSFGAPLQLDGALDADGWTTASVGYDQLDATVFGQPVDADPFAPDEASEIGIIISDGIDGDFALEVDWIDACR